jgi:hypothetical protein
MLQFGSDGERRGFSHNPDSYNVACSMQGHAVIAENPDHIPLRIGETTMGPML